MTLLDDVKTALRVTSGAYDAEARTLIDAARFELERVGIDPVLLALDPETQDLDNALVKSAVVVYAKAHFGYDNGEAERFSASFRRIETDLLNSDSNTAAAKAAEGEGEEGGEVGP